MLIKMHSSVVDDESLCDEVSAGPDRQGTVSDWLMVSQPGKSGRRESVGKTNISERRKGLIIENVKGATCLAPSFTGSISTRIDGRKKQSSTLDV